MCICVQSCFSCVQLFHQASLSMGFSRQEYWSGSPCSPPGDLPHPEMEPRSPALQVDSLLAELPVKTIKEYYSAIKKNKLLTLSTTWMNPKCIMLQGEASMTTHNAVTCL